MKKINYLLKGSFRRVTAFLLIFVMLFTSEGISVFASQEDQNDPVVTETGLPDESEHSTYIDNGDLQIESTDSIGAMLLEDIEEKKAEAEENGCAVFDAVVSGNRATFDIQTGYPGTLIAAIYDNAGEGLITSAKTDVAAENDSVTVDFAEELPEYFYLRAYIVDDELTPMSAVYECPLYTQGMQKFLSKTTDDFDEEDVLNLDEDKSNNFLVYQDGVIRIREAESSIRLMSSNEEELSYVFEDIQNELNEAAGIIAGNIISYERENGEILVIAIDKVSRSGDQLTISGKKSDKQEVFSYIKIDSSAYATEADIDTSDLEEGVSYEGITDAEEETGYSEHAVSEEADYFDGNAGIKKAFSFKLDKEFGGDSVKIKFKGSLKLSYESSIKYYFEILPWLWNGTYCEVKIGYVVTASVSISGSYKAAIPLATVGMMPIPGVFVEFTPSVILETSVALTYTATHSGQIGFRWEFGKDIINLTKGESKQELKGELTIFLGLSLEPKVKILCDEIAKAGITAKVGVEMKGSKLIGPEPDKMHGCSFCLNGDTFFKATLGFEIQMIWGALKYEVTLAEISIKIGDWYDSHDIGFGWGTCPNEYYKITYIIKDSKNKPVKKVKIRGEGMMVWDDAGNRQSVSEVITDAKGEAVVFQAKGAKCVRVSAVGYAEIDVPYGVTEEARKVDITLPSEMEKQYGGSHPRGGDPDGILKDPERHEDSSVTYSTVYFGNYWQNDTNGDGKADCDDEKEPIRWRVLKVEEDTLFLLADENLDSQPYFHEDGAVTWETSDIRSWLNYDFLNSAFSPEEQAVIRTSFLETANNELYRTPGGSATWDKIFLLSDKEAVDTAYGFLGDGYYDNAKASNNTRFAQKRSEYTVGSRKRYGSGAWWLRSPGNDADQAEFIDAKGYLDKYGELVHKVDKAVRPAIRILRSSELYFVAAEADMEYKEYSMYGGMDEEATAAEYALKQAIATTTVFIPSVTPDEEGVADADFSGLKRGVRYNVYAMKNEFADDRLSDDNLLYISQRIADESGKLAFSFIPKEVSENIAVFAVGQKAEDKGEITDPTDPIDPTDPTDPSDPDTPENDTIALTGINIDKKIAELLEGDTLTLKLSFTPEDATNKNVTWSSSDTAVAAVADGVVTAVKEGKAIIKAVSKDGDHEAVCEVTVKAKEGPLGPDKPDLSRYTASGNEIAVKSINLKKTYFKGVKGIKKFEVTSGDATAVKIKGSTLTVFKNGTVIVAAFSKKKEKLAEKTLTLIAPTIDTALQTEITRRGNLDLNKYISSTVKPAKWKSSSKKIAEVSPDGLLTMKKSGKVKITVTFPAEKGMKAKTLTIKLNIKMPQFKKATYTVKVGKSVQTAVKNADTAGIVYKIENPAIATVDVSGKVTGVSKGTTKLIMTVKGIEYEAKIKVK
ncbi:MAG: DUF6273 domain-containing protein [Lachnospiraceae bacterium]|nr:DUF6273 domain-containing protein [Lachnospiraceae bacterium]